MRTNDKYKDINWAKELDEYFALGDYPIRSFVRKKDYSYYAFKDRLYKDPRYHGRNSKWNKYDTHSDTDEPVFYPVVVAEMKSSDIRINGFTLTLDDSTDETVLRKLLTVMRDL